MAADDARAGGILMATDAPALALLLATRPGASLPGAAHGAAIGAVPDEPGVVVLPEAPIVQAVAADLDGDGGARVVRLVRGARGCRSSPRSGAEAGSGWALVAAMPVECRASHPVGTGSTGDLGRAPVRLLVRRVGRAIERVTVVQASRTSRRPDVGEPCCLLLDDLDAGAMALLLRPVSEPSGGRRCDLLSSTSTATAPMSCSRPSRCRRWARSSSRSRRASTAGSTIGFGPPVDDAAPVRIRRLAVSCSATATACRATRSRSCSTIGTPGSVGSAWRRRSARAEDAGGIVGGRRPSPCRSAADVASPSSIGGRRHGRTWPPGERPVSAASAVSSIRMPRCSAPWPMKGRATAGRTSRPRGAVHRLGLPDLLPLGA